MVEASNMSSQASSTQLAGLETPRNPENFYVEKPLPIPSRSQLCYRTMFGHLPRSLFSKRFPRLPVWLQLTGWRGTVSAGSALSISSLLINLILLMCVRGKPKDILTGAPVLFEGSCSRMQSIYTWSHLGINALSTLLLGASNAAMQCLLAPTRRDIDEAHAKGRWLDIGISGTNWLAMQRWRKVLWVSLVTTSIPLHVL